MVATTSRGSVFVYFRSTTPTEDSNHHYDLYIFRFGNPNLNLYLWLLLGGRVDSTYICIYTQWILWRSLAIGVVQVVVVGVVGASSRKWHPFSFGVCCSNSPHRKMPPRIFRVGSNFSTCDLPGVTLPPILPKKAGTVRNFLPGWKTEKTRWLGGGNSNDIFGIFTPKLPHFDLRIFFRWVETQPPTRYIC